MVSIAASERPSGFVTAAADPHVNGRGMTRIGKWRLAKRVSAVLGLIGIAVVAAPGSPVPYLLQQGYYQGELLWGRVPLDEAIETADLTDKQIEKLKLVEQVKAYGQRIGLSATDNYSTVNPTWNRTIYNVSACQPHAFEPVTYWFPIVGEVPYLGFFQEADATVHARALRTEGYDVRLRTAGAYSTLGWFEDPVLMNMLDWSEASLADTILHELVHATVWIPGSVQFNESFANFVGQEAARRYMLDKYGPDHKAVTKLSRRGTDRSTHRALLHQVYKDLDALYRDPDLAPAAKETRRRAIFAAIPTRVAQLPLDRSRAYVAAAQRTEWNNAKMMSFRRYNKAQDHFQAILDDEDGDLLSFILRIEKIAAGAKKPSKALQRAAEALEP